MLSKEDQEYNFLFRGGDEAHDKDDPYELIASVATHKKPVAGIVSLFQLYTGSGGNVGVETTSRTRAHMCAKHDLVSSTS